MRDLDFITPDGYIHNLSKEEQISFGAQKVPAKKAILSISGVTDYCIGSLKGQTPFVILGKSGQGQLGISILKQDGETIAFHRQELEIPILILNLNYQRIPNLLSFIENDDVLGRLAILDPNRKVTSRDELERLLNKQILVPPDARFKPDGSVELPLKDWQYEIEKAAINRTQIRNVLKSGRYALHRIQYSLSMQKNGYMLAPANLLIGAIELGLGEYHSIIEEKCDPDTVIHGSARHLDPFRTHGARQIEIFNAGTEEIAPQNIHVRFSFYKAPNALRVPVKFENLQKGYEITDLIRSVEIQDLYEYLRRKDIFGLVIGGDRYREIAKTKDPEIQSTIIRNSINDLVSNSRPSLDFENNTIKNFTRALDYLGGRSGKMLILEDLATEKELDTYYENGIGVVVFKNSLKLASGQTLPLYFTPSQVYHLQKLNTPPEPVTFINYDTSRNILLQYYKGLWMAPEERKRFASIQYWLNLYGSHSEEVSEGLLQQELIAFFRELARLTEKYNIGIVQGGGPGVMEAAASAAALYNIFSVGVGIAPEELQRININTDAFLGYSSGSRLIRQQYMDALGHIPIINIGGFGTFEELTITLTSTKLYENRIAPIIIMGGKEGFWQNAIQQIKKIVASKLGKDFILSLLHPCASYKEVAAVVEEYIESPEQWCRKRNISEADWKKSLAGNIKKRAAFGLTPDGRDILKP